MSITIKLDAPALRSLIVADPGFKLELQRAVVAEVVRNFIMRDAADIVTVIMPEVVTEVIKEMQENHVINEMIKKALLEYRQPAHWQTGKIEITDKMKAAVDSHIQAMVETLVAGSKVKVSELYAAMMERLDKYLASDAIPGHIKHDVDHKVIRAIQKGVDERLAALKEAI